MLKNRGEYVLNYQGEDVVFKFNTYAFLKFCEINGNLTYAEMLETFAYKLTIKVIAQLLMCAAKKGDEELACEWIDAMGGFNGAQLAEVVSILTEVISDNGAPVDDGKKKVENP